MNKKYACPSCKSSWVKRNSRTVYSCHTCDHVFGLKEAIVLEKEIVCTSKPEGEKAGRITIGQQCMQWNASRRYADK